MWINLHNYSYFSFLRGLASPLALAQAAAAQQMPALALTDHGLLSGAIEFYDACRGVGVKPILGLEIPVTANRENAKHTLLAGGGAVLNGRVVSGNLVLLASDLSGWSNLCRLSSAIQTGDEATLLLERLAEHADGLMCLTGGRRGFGANLLEDGLDDTLFNAFERLSDIFPDRLYAEIQAWQGPILSQRPTLVHECAPSGCAIESAHFANG